VTGRIGIDYEQEEKALDPPHLPLINGKKRLKCVGLTPGYLSSPEDLFGDAAEAG
jgi:hypothetical protein